MKPYLNRSGNSTVKSFQIYGDGIKIKFDDGTVFLYLYDNAGKEVVEKMKMFALEGKGLGTYLQSTKNLGEKLDES